METKQYTELSNSFHNTSTRTTKTFAELEKILYRIGTGTATQSERALIRRIRRSLCPVTGCKCGDGLGQR